MNGLAEKPMFCRPVPREERQMISMAISPALKDKIREVAHVHQISASELMRLAVTAYLEFLEQG